MEHSESDEHSGQMSRSASVPDDFEFETRLVVLNFMGLLPSSCPGTACFDRAESMLQRHSSCEDDLSVDRTLPELNRLENFHQDGFCTVIRKGDRLMVLKESDLENELDRNADEINQCDLDGEQARCLSQPSQKAETPSVNVIPASPNFENHAPHVNESNEVEISLSGFLEADQSRPVSVAGSASKWSGKSKSTRSDSNASGHSGDLLSVSLAVGRQGSWQSDSSGRRSFSFGRHNSYIDVSQVDVEPLVRNGDVSPIAVPLKEEIFAKRVDCFEKSGTQRSLLMIPQLSQFPHSMLESTAVTPESQVADKLRAIGDRIQEEYLLDLNQAVDDLLQMEGNGQLTFNALQSTALELLNNVSPGWTRVVLTLLLGQRVALGLLETGNRSVGRMVDYTAQFICSHVSDFILSRGGWNTVADLGFDETPLPLNDQPILFIPPNSFQVPRSNQQTSGTFPTTEISEPNDTKHLANGHPVILGENHHPIIVTQISSGNDNDVLLEERVDSTSDVQTEQQSDIFLVGICMFIFAGTCLAINKLRKS